ncbi:hypothetical protein KJ975_00415 [Myxococcota bacterium]|nr:hypothetical protein [Myxococcota bacterium]
MASIDKIYELKTAKEPEKTQINLSSGKLCLFESGNIDAAKALDRKVQPGTCTIDIFRLSDDVMPKYEASPTSGISAVVLHFTDKVVTTWQEVTSRQGTSPIDSGDMVDWVVADHETLDGVAEQLEPLLDDCYSDGFATCESALVCYVGEVALEHRFFWGLDAAGKAAKLFAFFVYPDEGLELDEAGEDAGKGAGKEVQFKVEGVKYQVTIPEHVTGKVEVDVCDTDIDIKVGKGFHLEACALVFSEPNPEQNYLQKQKQRFSDKGILKEIIKEEGTSFFYRSEERGAEDYRFIRVVKAGNEYFELRECPHDRPFAKEVAEAMLQAAQSFTLVE